MKKNIILLLFLTVVPYTLCFICSLFSEKISIGQGDNSLKYHLMGKEIFIEMNGLYKSIDVEEYVMGVLPGTISPDYDEEALKVQAILIRTNVLKEMQENATSDASDLSYHYLTVEDRIDLFGDLNYEKYSERFEQAVVETAGQVIKSEDSMIMALYHEVSIGKTVSAKEIIGEDISYLQSVDSSQDVEAKHYMNLVMYTWEELWAMETGNTTENVTGATDSASEGAVASADGTENGQIPEQTIEKAVGKLSIEVLESTENGYVKQLSVEGNIYTGEEAMERYGLPSSNFYVEEVEGGIRFVCLGKGNGMGLSQYGANHMAISGKKTEEIIKYYYPGVSLVTY